MRPMLSCPFARHLIRRTGGSDVSGQMLKLTNTLTGRQEVFTPADDETVRLYTCGPTVYNFVHIGNLRTYVFEDILRRHLASKWKLRHVMNITDIDDKIINRSIETGQDLKTRSEEHTSELQSPCNLVCRLLLE